MFTMKGLVIVRGSLRNTADLSKLNEKAVNREHEEAKDEEQTDKIFEGNIKLRCSYMRSLNKKSMTLIPVNWFVQQTAIICLMLTSLLARNSMNKFTNKGFRVF